MSIYFQRHWNSAKKFQISAHAEAAHFPPNSIFQTEILGRQQLPANDHCTTSTQAILARAGSSETAYQKGTFIHIYPDLLVGPRCLPKKDS